MTTDDPIWDDLHGCAWAAYIDLAQQERRWPDPEATSRLAIRSYEHSLAEKNGVVAEKRERI